MFTLIERLKYLASCGQEELGSVPVSLLEEAADELNRYACHVEDLQAELDAKYKAELLRRPWWWKLIGLDHVKRS